MGTEWYCVQCVSDDDCGLGGTCDTNTFSCSGGTVAPTDACEKDSDCDAGITEFDLACDTQTGYCYDAKGKCDGVTAFCKGGGECLNLLDVLTGGGGGLPSDFPGMMGGGGGATLPGYCECESSGGGLEGLFGGLLGGGDGPCGEATCLPLGDVLGFGGGVGGGGTEEGVSVCFDLGDLLGN